MMRCRACLLLLVPLALAIGACRDKGNDPESAYRRLRAAILEDDMDAVYRMMPPSYRMAHRRFYASVRDRILRGDDAALRAGYSRELGGLSPEQVAALSEEDLVIRMLRYMPLPELQRDWVEKSRLMDEADVEREGPDLARVWVVPSVGRPYGYGFIQVGGRWWWKPATPIPEEFL